MMKNALSLVIMLMVISLMFAVARADQAAPLTCRWTARDGSHYDLNALYRGFNGQYSAKDDGHTYSFNVCGASLDKTCVAKGGGSGIGCQYDRSGELVAALAMATNTVMWSQIDRGVVMTYLTGDECWAVGVAQQRVVNFEFVCSATNSTVASVIESPVCTYTIRLGTPYACGSPVIDTCKYRATQLGLSWDLTSLKSTQDYQYKAADGKVYTLAFCGASKQMATPCGRNANSACVYDPSGAFLLGLGGTDVTPPGQWSLINEQHPTSGIEQTFINGDFCIDGTGQRVPAKLNIRVYCNPTGSVTPFAVAVDDATCTYTYTFAVPQGCPF